MMVDRFRNKYRIPSARANWHNYDGGIYFITICTLHRIHHFGEIVNAEMRLSAVGEIAKEVLENEATHYVDIEIPEYVIMPNHIHLIVFLNTHVSASQIENDVMASRKGIPQTELGTVVRNIKARISYQSRKRGYIFKWQPRYFDRVVRSHEELNRIGKYIEDNVGQWDLDEYNKSEGEWY